MEAVFSWVKNIVVFFLVLTLLEEILPDSDYKKYIRAAAGMVFILIVFSPLLKLFNVDGSVDYFFQWESFKNALAFDDGASLDSFDGSAAALQKESWVLDQYKGSLKEQMQALVENEGYTVASLEIDVEEDKDSEDFGAVMEVRLVLGAVADDRILEGSGSAGDEEAQNDKGSSKVEPVEKVEPVAVDGLEAPVTAKNENKASDEAFLPLKELLSANYGVPVNQIVITMEGGSHG